MKNKLPLGIFILILGFTVLTISIYIPKTIQANIKYFRGHTYIGYPKEWQEYMICCEWLKENTHKDAVILSRKPELTYWWSGRKSLIYPFPIDTIDCSETITFISQCDYIIIDNIFQTTRLYLLPALREDTLVCGIPFKFGNTYILEVK